MGYRVGDFFVANIPSLRLTTLLTAAIVGLFIMAATAQRHALAKQAFWGAPETVFLLAGAMILVTLTAQEDVNVLKERRT